MIVKSSIEGRKKEMAFPGEIMANITFLEAGKTYQLSELIKYINTPDSGKAVVQADMQLFSGYNYTISGGTYVKQYNYYGFEFLNSPDNQWDDDPFASFSTGSITLSSDLTSEDHVGLTGFLRVGVDKASFQEGSYFGVSFAIKGSIFSSKAETVDFNNLSYGQKAAIGSGSSVYNGRGGGDVVTLPDRAHYNDAVIGANLNWQEGAIFTTGSRAGETYQVIGGDGSDNIKGGAGTDVVRGRAGNDRIDGGKGMDIAVFEGSYFDYSIKYNPNSANGSMQAIVSSKGSSAYQYGRDVLENIEVAQFADRTVLLNKWEIVVTRDVGHAGIAKLSFLENGKVVGGFSNLPAWYDDATPVPVSKIGSSYEAVLRTNGGVSGWASCIELADNHTGVSSALPRTAVQIHGGASPQNSEGCIVLGGEALRGILGYMKESFDFAKLSSGRIGGSGLEGYSLEHAITVRIDGEIPQPKLRFGSDIALLEGQTKNVVLDLANDINNHGISKAINITLKIDQSLGCFYGTDWMFQGKGSYYDPNSHAILNGVDLNSLYDWRTGTISFVMPADSTKIPLAVKALIGGGNEAQEKLGFTISDIDILRVKNGKWLLHRDSQDYLERDGSSHLGYSGSPTITEKLLFGNKTKLNILIDDNNSASKMASMTGISGADEGVVSGDAFLFKEVMERAVNRGIDISPHGLDFASSKAKWADLHVNLDQGGNSNIAELAHGDVVQDRLFLTGVEPVHLLQEGHFLFGSA